MLKNLRVRTKLIALLAVPLAGLIVMATIGVLDRQADAAEARDGRKLAELTSARVDLAHQLQLERRWTAVVVGSDGAIGVPELAAQREVTNSSTAAFAAAADDARGVNADLAAQIDRVLADLEQLPTVRASVDSGQAVPQAAMASYTQTIADLTELADVIALSARDTDLHGDLASLVPLAAAKESLAAVDAQLAETLAAGQGREFEFTAASRGRAEFQDQLLRFVGLGSKDARAELRGVESEPASVEHDRFLSQILASGFAGPFPVSSADWAAASTSRLEALRSLEDYVTTAVATEAKEVEDAATAAARTYLLGAMAITFVSLLLASIVARSIARPLTKLTAGAYRLSEERLPALVEQLRNPNSDRVGDTLEPIEIDSRDEIGQLANAFNSIQEVTKNVAAEQATLLRKGIGDIFVNLARRNQTLLDRQIEFIDQLESNEEDPDQLENLFKLDHLATRMRRNAESLLVLAGAEPPRRRGRPVDMADVVRVAIGEVEHFARITLLALDDATVSATVAVDLAHLLSELMENATQFSPPETHVEIVGHKTRDGNYVLSISDQGIGMTPDQLAEANQLMANPPVVGLALSRSLGFIVIGRLASRFGVAVRLTSSPSGGVSALVSLPNTLIDVGVFSEPSSATVVDTGEVVNLALPVSDVPTAPALPAALAQAAAAVAPAVDLTANPPVVTGIEPEVVSGSEREATPAPPQVPATDVPTPVELGLTPIIDPSEVDEPTSTTSDNGSYRNGTGPSVHAPEHGLLPPPPPPPAPPAPPVAPVAPATDNGHGGLPPLPTRVRPTDATSPLPGSPAEVAPAMAPAAPAPTAAAVTPPLPTRHPQPVTPDSPTTAGGLTRRVPKATQPSSQLAPGAPVSATQRTPEEVRLMLSRYRSGLRRGRIDDPIEGSEES